MKLKKADIVASPTIAATTAETLGNAALAVANHTEVIQNVGKDVTVNPAANTISYKGESFSVLAMLDADDLKVAQQLANVDVRTDAAVLGSFGMDAFAKMDALIQKALDMARQMDLDIAINTKTEELVRIVDTGLDLALIYQEPSRLEKAFPFVSRLKRFLEKVETINYRLELLKGKLTRDDAALLARMTTYSAMEDNFAAQVEKFYLYAGASEIIMAREQGYLAELQAAAKEYPQDTRIALQVQRQKTVVLRVQKRMFYLLSQAINSFLKVNILEEGLRAVQISHDTVIEAIYGAVGDLKQSIAMILNQYKTARAAQLATQVKHTAVEALKKVSAQMGITNDMLVRMNDEDLLTIAAYYQVKDDLVDQVTRGNEIMAIAKENFAKLGQASVDITKTVNAALAA